MLYSSADPELIRKSINTANHSFLLKLSLWRIIVTHTSSSFQKPGE